MVWETVLAAVLFVGLAVLLLGVNVFFFRRPFPDGEIASNAALRRKGIRCAKEEEMCRVAGRRDGTCGGGCADCGLLGARDKTHRA